MAANRMGPGRGQFALQYARHGRAGEAFVGAIDFGQQLDIRWRRETRCWMTPQSRQLKRVIWAVR